MADEDYRRLAAACACGQPVLRGVRGRPAIRCNGCIETRRRDAEAAKEALSTVSCDCCGAQIKQRVRSHKFCNIECYRKAKHGWDAKQVWHLQCTVCSDKYDATNKNSIYCGNRCKLIAFKRKRGLNPMTLEERNQLNAEKRLQKQELKAQRKVVRAVIKAAQRSHFESKPAKPKPLCVEGCGSEARADGRRCPRCSAVHAKRIRKAHKIKYKAQRRVREKISAESVDPIRVFDLHKWKCQQCGIKTPKRMRGTSEDNAPELDHIITLADKGGHTWGNVRCLCRKCNGIKGSRSSGQLGLGFS